MMICNATMNHNAKSKESRTLEPPEAKGNQMRKKEELSRHIMLNQMKSHSPEQETNPQKHARNEGVTTSDGKGAARPLKRRVRFKPGLVEGKTINSGLVKSEDKDKKRWNTVSTQPKSILKKEVPGSGNRHMPTNVQSAAYITRPNALDLLLLCTQVRSLLYPLIKVISFADGFIKETCLDGAQAFSKFETHWSNLQNLDVSARSVLKHSL